MDWTFTDAATISGARVTADGYMAADVRCARTGIQSYRGYEVGKPDMKDVRIFRPEEEVFHADALASLAHRPITNDHPSEQVNASNWKRVAVGQTGDGVVRDGGFVRVPMVLMDQTAIDAVKGGKRELSLGYDCELDWTPGVTADGQPYDAIQRNIRGNHLAIVDAGRAGHACRIGDKAAENNGGRQMSGTNLKTVLVDGIPIETTDAAATVIDTLQKRVAEITKTAGEAKATHDAALAAKDAELGKKDAEIVKLKASQIDDAKLDALVTARTAVIAKAKIVDKDVKTEGVAIPAIRRAAVVARLGDDAVKDKSDDYVEALFDGLAAAGEARDPIAEAARASLGDKAKGGGSPETVRDAAYQEYLDGLTGVKKEAK
mgnify:CR=1 FL=1